MHKLIAIFQNLTNSPKHYVLAARELESAKKSYLEHKTHAEYYSTLCSFETQRIKRLEQYLGVIDHT
jgi:hypothetical protein